MIVYGVTKEVLDTESFPHHDVAGLISGITFIVLFNQEKPLRWKEIHTHTHTHTHTPALANQNRKQLKPKIAYNVAVFGVI